MADTITITVNAVDIILVRVNNDNFSNEYYKRMDGKDYRLLTRHSSDKVPSGAGPRDRHVITFTERVFPTATTPETTRQTSVSIVGSAYELYDAQSDVALGLMDFLTEANIQKLIGKEV